MELVQNWFVGKYYERKQKKLLPKVDHVLTVSDELALRLGGATVLYNSEPIEVVEMPVENHKFGMNGVIAGYIGGLRKRILEEILECVSKVNALSLLIVGGPPKGRSGYSQMINELVHICLEHRDYTTHNFLQWYVAEQIEEEALARTILDKLALIGNDKGGLYLFDRDIAQILSLIHI